MPRSSSVNLPDIVKGRLGDPTNAGAVTWYFARNLIGSFAPELSTGITTTLDPGQYHLVLGMRGDVGRTGLHVWQGLLLPSR